MEQQVIVLHGRPADIDFAAPVASLEERGRPSAGLDRMRNVRRMLRETDLVQAHGGEALKHAIPALLGTRTPVVYRRIGGRLPRLSPPRRSFYRALIKRAAMVVTLTEGGRAELIDELGVHPARVALIPNAIDPARFARVPGRSEARRALGLSDHDKVILSLGALVEDKDPLGHLAVTRPVVETRDDVVHVFVGQGHLEPQLRHSIGASTGFRIVPEVADASLPLAAADVLLLASRSEGTPAVVLEARLCGLPVAAYEIGGVAEALPPHAVRLAPVGDVDALRARVCEWLDSAERPAPQLPSAAAHAFAEVADAYLRVYRGVLNR
ncbi:MAG: glycosyltransferase [Actinomycetota bacterium]